MSSAHLANLVVHIGTGIIALAIGLAVLARTKGTGMHKRWGRRFCLFTLAVCFTAAIGTICFRFIPLFAVLTLLVPYQLLGGWRSAKKKASGPSAFDGVLTALAWVLAGALVPALLAAPAATNIVVISSLAALALVLGYDSVRWLFPRRWFRVLWKYEHSYKLVSSFFAMLSALVGNMVRIGQPWSQIAPSAIGLVTILYFFHQLHQQPEGQALGLASGSSSTDAG